jgi:hypothetical protein
MSEDVQVRSGWGDTRAERISAPTLQRIAAADREQARADALAERDRQLMREQAAADAFRASVEAAVERGESIDPRQAHLDGGVGHTVREFVELCAARQDVEDAQAAARQAAEFRRWQAQQAAAASGDTTAPREAETPQLVAARANADRAIREGEVLRRAGRQAERTARRVAHQGDVRLAGRLVERGVL